MLTRHGVRRIKRGRYEILAVETRHPEQGDTAEILWSRQDKPDAIREGHRVRQPANGTNAPEPPRSAAN